MALSLDKVGKTTKAKSKKKQSADSVAPVPARPKERPWSQRGLARQGRSPKEGHGDSHVNDDWMSLHEAPLFWIDFSTEARLAALQEKLLDLEQKATKLVRKPTELIAFAKKKLRSLIA